MTPLGTGDFCPKMSWNFWSPTAITTELQRHSWHCIQKLLYGSVLPVMADQLDHVDSMEFVLPAFTALIKRVTADEYQRHIRLYFNRVFKTTRSVQVSNLFIYLCVISRIIILIFKKRRQSFNPSFNFLFSLGLLLYLSASLFVCLSLYIVLCVCGE